MTRGAGESRASAADVVDAQAAFFVAQYRLGTIDEAAFQAWRSRAPAHAIAFARTLAMLENLEDVLAADARRVSAPMARRTLLRAAAAAVAIGVVGGGITTGRAYAWSTAATALGESRTVRLSDGSVAALNTDSRLSWRFSDSARCLWVERGEIALNLRPGAAAIVHGGGRGVMLSEGRFNLRRRDAALDLLVLAGRAEVRREGAAGGAIVDSRHGTRSLLVSKEAAIARVADAAQVDGITAWQRNEILFQDATLGSAVEEYNRFLPRKIVIVDRELASIPVGGRFTTTDPTAFLKAVTTGLNVRVSESSTAYLLTR